MIKSTGIPFAATHWLRENNMKPESVSIDNTDVICYFDHSMICMNLQGNKIKSIRYSPKPTYN